LPTVSEKPSKCTIVAEVAQAHDGSLGFAHAFIDAAARAGADAIKFQTHLADAESSPLEPWRVRFSPQDDRRYDYWKRMEFSEEQWVGLRKHANDAGLQFLSSPFSVEAAELLKRVGVAAWKIASGELTNIMLLDCIADSGLPVYLSTGMSTLSEIDAAVNRLLASGLDVTVFQCTSEYPCPPEKVGLNMIPFFRERYGCKVGLSDHSGTIFPGLAAATLGVDVIEVHLTLSREMFGPDVPASLTSGELRELVDGVRFIGRMATSPVDKDEAAAALESTRAIFCKSVASRAALRVGQKLQLSDLTLKKPGHGIPAGQLPSLVGRIVCRDVPRGAFLAEADLEPVGVNQAATV
jgi:N-acetylneuraminate synthase